MGVGSVWPSVKVLPLIFYFLPLISRINANLCTLGHWGLVSRVGGLLLVLFFCLSAVGYRRIGLSSALCLAPLWPLPGPRISSGVTHGRPLRGLVACK